MSDKCQERHSFVRHKSKNIENYCCPVNEKIKSRKKGNKSRWILPQSYYLCVAKKTMVTMSKDTNFSGHISHNYKSQQMYYMIHRLFIIKKRVENVVSLFSDASISVI